MGSVSYDTGQIFEFSEQIAPPCPHIYVSGSIFTQKSWVLTGRNKAWFSRGCCHVADQMVRDQMPSKCLLRCHAFRTVLIYHTKFSKYAKFRSNLLQTRENMSTIEAQTGSPNLPQIFKKYVPGVNATVGPRGPSLIYICNKKTGTLPKNYFFDHL